MYHPAFLPDVTNNPIFIFRPITNCFENQNEKTTQYPFNHSHFHLFIPISLFVRPCMKGTSSLLTQIGHSATQAPAKGQSGTKRRYTN